MPISINGLQAAQDTMLRGIRAMRPNDARGRAVKEASVMLHRYATAITHVDTGSLRASHFMDLSGERGRIYINPRTRNPFTGERPAVYGVIEHDRGGDHAFYERTVIERGNAAMNRGADVIVRGIYGR